MQGLCVCGGVMFVVFFFLIGECMIYVLIVEDDVDLVVMFKELVVSQGFIVFIVGNFVEVCKQLVFQLFDIVLLDLWLFDGSGMDLFNDLELLVNFEVVFIIGYVSLDIFIFVLCFGVVDYIVKFINFMYL